MTASNILTNQTYNETNRIATEVISLGFRLLSDEFKINIEDIIKAS